MITITGELQGYPLQSNLRHDENSGRITGDRAVDSEYLQDFWKTFFTTGVVQIPTSALQVMAEGTMAVRINSGICLIDGVLGRAKYDLFISFGSSSTTADLQYRVCLRRDLSLAVRQIVVSVREGNAAPIREGDIFEIVLADVTVPRLSTTITQSNITDRRNDPALCGHIRAPINNPDLSAFVRQVDAFMNESTAEWLARFNALHTAQDTAWRTWHTQTDTEWRGWHTQANTEWRGWMEYARNLHALMETKNFSLINHNFDDLSTNRGCEVEVVSLPDGNVHETKIVLATGDKIAERFTQFNVNGNQIVTTIAHLPWEREENGNTVMSIGHEITATTTFDGDKIRTVIS